MYILVAGIFEHFRDVFNGGYNIEPLRGIIHHKDLARTSIKELDIN